MRHTRKDEKDWAAGGRKANREEGHRKSSQTKTDKRHESRGMKRATRK